MIEEAIFETAHLAAVRYKRIVDSGMSETDKGHEMFGQAWALDNVIRQAGLSKEYERWLKRKREDNGLKNKII